MADNVSSDNPAVTEVRAKLARRGRTDRATITIPEEHHDAFPVGEVVRLVLSGTQYFAKIESPLGSDDPEIRGAYDNARLARNPGEGENHLDAWVRNSGRSFGSSVLVDIVEKGFLYGVRVPGQRAVYKAVESPNSSLADIARNLDEN
ncbi:MULTISPECIES: hypothetical protein [unclassified Haladaptatus]|uniref:DUF7112 family protein n=1 Tax=unclassified Haladaptatus TaxID=2622732 RepID=UPI0023E81C2D|nr:MULTISPECIES: hypothetical protein [unclassified Haladaptatus]